MKNKKRKIEWKKANKIILIVQLVVFFLFGLYISLNIKFGIGPDEHYHLYVAQAYSKVWGVPENTPETYQWGDITSANFLAHWINGRLLNMNFLKVDEIHLLKIFNLLTSVGTLFLFYKLTGYVIKEEKYRTIPVILLANTLMFQFLSGMINYDNLTNFFAVLSIIYFVKIFKEPKEIKNYVLWAVFTCLGALTKYTIFPLALIEFILILVILIKEKVKFNIKEKKFWLYLLLVLIFLLPVVLLYGKNIVTYKHLFPRCEEIMTVEQCMNSGVFRRDYGQSAGIKLLSKEGIGMVFSRRWNPVKYFLKWSWEMNHRIYGIMAHKDMFMPHNLHLTFAIYPISFVFLFLKDLKKKEKLDIYLLIVLLFYTFVLAFVQNYPTYLNRNGVIFALQGRYIFPVIFIYYTLLVKYIGEIKNKYVRILFFVILITMFLLSCIPFFLLSVTPDWFV